MPRDRQELTMSHLMNTYGRQPVAFSHGEGVWVWDTEGRRYLDALAGIAVNTLGHAHPKLTRVLTEQVGRLMHTSNLYRITAQEQAADKIAARTRDYEERFLSPFVAAERGYLDEVIMPHSTRRRIARALALLQSKKADTLWRKHDNLPL